MAISAVGSASFHYYYSHLLLYPCSSSSSNTHFPPFNNPLNFRPYCSQNTIQTQTQTQKSQPLNTELQFQKKTKKRRKPKPSFHDQIRDKWSVKPISHTQIFPWQLQHDEDDDEEENSLSSSEMVVETSTAKESESTSAVSDSGANLIHEPPILGFNQPVSEPVNSSSIVDSSTSTANLVTTYENDVGKHSKLYNHIKLSGDNLVNNSPSKKLVECEGNVEEDSSKVVTGYDDVGSGMITTSGNEGFFKGKSRDMLPWMVQKDSENAEEYREKKNKTVLAEKLIPEHELKRLRNVALRMKERITVGPAGVTQALVDDIHHKWKIDEVVKLKFKGRSMVHMKRIHEVLESRTGGLVIWRSGSSVVLFRGLTYKLDCVQTYKEEKKVTLDTTLHPRKVSDSMTVQKEVHDEDSVELTELNSMLDELGPRYIDWSGPPPLPVDADLLPGAVPGYKTPFRLLPYGVRRHLRDAETTHYRRDARITHPHFALGRNRELQGLAAAMVKLWEKSAIAKIAIKRGVLNTCNDRMAEELKRLTGGTLLSRNKEYIVFYRGNDFLPPNVTESLKEKEKMTMLQYQEEEERRSATALVNVNSKNYKAPLVAGTLAETVAATSRWGKKPSNEDVEKMMKQSALARRDSLLTHLRKKLAVANLKLKKAEKALEKVHGNLELEDLPTDLETISDEERIVFRKMGLSMKPYLLLGRREVFDGTIENIHLHWKFRELVKVIVKDKNFAQVKHVAINLEAESGGVLVSVDKTTKGYAIIIYRGKNYRQPVQLRPRNLLTKRQALARSIELQRLKGLRHHISSLQEQMELLKSDIEDMKNGIEIDDHTFYAKWGDASTSFNDDNEEDEGEEAYLQIYDSGDENGAS